MLVEHKRKALFKASATATMQTYSLVRRGLQSLGVVFIYKSYRIIININRRTDFKLLEVKYPSYFPTWWVFHYPWRDVGTGIGALSALSSAFMRVNSSDWTSIRTCRAGGVCIPTVLHRSWTY